MGNKQQTSNNKKQASTNQENLLKKTNIIGVSLNKKDKTEIILKEFDALKIGDNDLLSQEELNHYLDKMVIFFLILDKKNLLNQAGKVFDKDVFAQLYERMDKNYDGKISRDQFIQVFFEADEILLFKIENSKKYIEDYKLQQQNARTRLNDVKKTEVLNTYGIMTDSVVTISFIEWNNTENANAYCVLKCGKENYQSEASKDKWNETFSLNIETGKEEIEIILFSNTPNNEKIGKTILKTDKFKDQKQHDEWFDLEENSVFRIHLNLQWIYSKVKFLSDVVEKWNEAIKIQEEDLLDYEKDLEILYEPFKMSGIKMGNSLNANKYNNKPPQKGINLQKYDNSSPEHSKVFSVKIDPKNIEADFQELFDDFQEKEPDNEPPLLQKTLQNKQKNIDILTESKIMEDFISILKRNNIEIIDNEKILISRKKLLGKGGNGRVYKGFFLKKEVAIKEYFSYNIYDNQQNEKNDIIKEFVQCLTINIPKANKFYGVFFDKNGLLYSVHELAECSLEEKLKEKLDLKTKHDLAKQILEIMTQLSKKNIIHRDLKPENLLINKSGELQICDFGSIRKLQHEETITENCNYTIRYAPPEFIQELGVAGLYSDIWSLGLILFYIYYGEKPWKGLNQNKIKEKILMNQIPKVEYDENVPKKITDIIKKTLVLEGKKRICIEEINNQFEKLV